MTPAIAVDGLTRRYRDRPPGRDLRRAMIPVIPVPPCPGPGRAPVLGPDLRASDFDRDVAADMLCAAVADGRITLAELDQRLENVLSARTLREIARVMADLPGPRFAQPVPAARPETRWSLLQSAVSRAAS